jgi:hypothetical protein
MSSDLIEGYLTLDLNQPIKWAYFRLDALLVDTMLTKLYATWPRSNGCFLKFSVEVGVEESIVNAQYGLRVSDQLFKSYAFTRVVRSQSTLQRQLRRHLKKKQFVGVHSKMIARELITNYFHFVRIVKSDCYLLSERLYILVGSNGKLFKRGSIIRSNLDKIFCTHVRK